MNEKQEPEFDPSQSDNLQIEISDIERSLLESSLGSATPLPCSVDSMQLMFEAGVQQQKRRAGRSRNLLFASSGLCVLFMLTTALMASWNYRLASQNSNLLAKIESGIEKENSEAIVSQGPSHQPAFGRRESDQEKPVEKKQQIDSGADRNSVEPATTINRAFLTYQAVDSLRSDGVKPYMLRGVALRPEDEYKKPASFSAFALTPSERESNEVSTPSNLSLRRRMQSDFIGL